MAARRAPSSPRRRRLLAAATAAAAAASSSSASATSALQRDGRREDDADRTFFDLSDWDEAELDELRDDALAIRGLKESGDGVDWYRPFFNDGIGGVRGRRLSEEAAHSDRERGGGGVLRRAQFDLRAPPKKRGKVTYTMDLGGGSPPAAVADLRGSTGGRANGKVKLGGGVKRPAEDRVGPQPRRDFRCIDPTASGVPCPPPDLGQKCDKYAGGDFRTCYTYCKPSFCCIHDSLSKTYSPSCAKTEPNCPSYFACYIVWWKLHDTVGPANYLRINQDEPFYNVDFDYILGDLESDPEFFQQLFGHHFDGDDTPTDDTFEDRSNW